MTIGQILYLEEIQGRNVTVAFVNQSVQKQSRFGDRFCNWPAFCIVVRLMEYCVSDVSDKSSDKNNKMCLFFI